MTERPPRVVVKVGNKVVPLNQVTIEADGVEVPHWWIEKYADVHDPLGERPTKRARLEALAAASVSPARRILPSRPNSRSSFIGRWKVFKE